MKSEQIATLSFKFESLDCICQVGSNIDNDNSLYIIAIGRKEGQAN
jgi:hypothetical protein